MMAQESDEQRNIPMEKTVKLSSRVKQYSKDELKDFEKQSELGCGGYGSVCKYLHKDKLVAIKEFAFKGDDEAMDKIWNTVLIEANSLCHFHHENIVEFLGITRWPKGVGIVLEYIDGGNLQDFVSQSELSWNIRLEIARGIISGLEYIHYYGEKKTFCHGDLKPGNVLLTKSLQAKLADFGSAAFYRATSASTTTFCHVPSKQYTLNYVAPEFLKDNTREKNPAMDMYSFGMLLYELISKKVPFSDCPMPHFLLALILNNNKPNTKPLDETGSQLKSDDDRAVFNLLKNLMEKCWNDDPASRPTSKTVKMELDSYGMNQQNQDENLRYTDHEAQNVDAEKATNERKAPTRRKIIGRESFAPKTSAQQPSMGDNQFSPSSAGMPKQRPCENTTSKKITNRKGTFASKSSPRVEATSDEASYASDPPTLLATKKRVKNFLESYQKCLLKRNFKEAKNCLATLRSFLANDIKATAEDIRLKAVKLQDKKKYLQSIALFDTAAALFAKMKNPAEDLKMVQFCIQGMTRANEGLDEKDRTSMLIVKEHVIPLMRNWVREMKGASQVSEKWQCHAVSWALSNIEGCELMVGQMDERKQTLEEAVSKMREVFGSDVYKQQGRLFGNLVDHLAGVYNDDLRFDKAKALYEEALKAREVAEDYFGDEEDRKDDIRITTNNLRKNLKDTWEKQMRMY